MKHTFHGVRDENVPLLPDNKWVPDVARVGEIDYLVQFNMELKGNSKLLCDIFLFERL